MLHVASFEEKRVLADLPVERCIEVPPVIFCGGDMFGPYLIKERRSQLKRYGALLTCFTCSSLHVEGSWLEEELLVPSGQTMEQILWKQRMNCSKYSRK